MTKVLSELELKAIDGYFRAVNYVSAASLYLKDNALLKRPLTFEDIKSKLIGHWGSAPGQNFVYTHCDRIIKKYNLNMMWISGPGHSGQATMANTYFEGSYGYRYPEFTQDEKGLVKFMKHFSFPGGTSSHVAPEVPGSINEGGELGYSLAHAFGAVLDNPNLFVTVIIGDGEAETGPLATSWHGNKFLNPKTDGAVIPVLHLNGYKIANPTVLSRISHEELEALLKGYGWTPYFVEGSDPLKLHELMAKTMDEVVERILEIQKLAREENVTERPLWPMIVLRTPKGWTGPKKIDGKQIEGSFRAHQVPIEVTKEHPESLKHLENWLKSYHPEELFDKNGTLKEEYRMFIPELNHAMGQNPNANGGELLQNLKMPDFKKYAVKVPYPGSVEKEDMRVLGTFLRDVVKENEETRNFRIFGPDEALSNRLNNVFEVTRRQWDNKILKTDEFLSFDGRIMDSFLSEHMCEGWIEGYLLTGRHGLFHSYESFIRIVDSMISQHAKWMKVASEISWRKPISSLNLLVTSHCWQQDHNGFTHQDPGIINHVINKKTSMSRVYLPCDSNTLLSVMNHVLQTKNYVNVIVASKHPRPQWLSMSQAIRHCEKGLGIWAFASNDIDNKPDLVMACAGDTPTLEVMAATSILRKYLPNLKVRVVNIVDLMKLEANHPHGLSDTEYNYIFTKNKPIVFAFHGYPNVIHELTYKRVNQNMHVRGYIEEGTITTPFDMRVQNKIDRFHLILLAIEYLPQFDTEDLRLYCESMLERHKAYIREYGIDMEEITNWKWDL
ncbi:TPA: phosphoketolase family protein [Candidatus Ventrenecus avicola]|nr:phosphoketolase family protein [Candidatus Ventrenecus avicola]